MTTDMKDDEGRTPLHLAALTGDTDLVRILIEAGADVAAKDAQGALPLHLAVSGGHTDAVRMLIEAESGSDDAATRPHRPQNSSEKDGEVDSTAESSGVSPTIENSPTVTTARTEGLSTNKVFASDRQCEKCRVWNRQQFESCAGCGSTLRQSTSTPAMTSTISEVQDRRVHKPISGYKLCGNCGMQNREWIELCVVCKFPMSGDLQEESSNDVFVWIAAFVPIAVIALEWVAFEQSLSGGQRYPLFAVIYGILFGIDLWRLNADGFELDGWMIVGLVLLAPLYLFRRIAVVEGSYRYSYATVWVITFVLSVLITVLVFP